MATTPAAPNATNLTWSDVRRGIAQLCRERGWHHGVPIMSSIDTTRRVILAKGCPLSDTHGHGVPVSMSGDPVLHVCSDGDVNEAQDEPYAVNTWFTAPKRVTVGKYSKGAVVVTTSAARERLDLLLNGVLCQAGAVDSDTELRAMCALRTRVNDNQWDAYILAGAFPETSKRSGVTYLLRKGLPTLALRMKPVPGGEKRHFLAALCSHPLAYFEGTHVGCYPPTDEVVANLLAIRADEHAFWKRANQHTLDDPLGGV